MYCDKCHKIKKEIKPRALRHAKSRLDSGMKQSRRLYEIALTREYPHNYAKMQEAYNALYSYASSALQILER